MNEREENLLRQSWAKVVGNSRRESLQVDVGPLSIGGNSPVAVQTMTDTDTNDTEACLNQIERIHKSGCRIIRLTTQGLKEVESFGIIARQVHDRWPDTALIADVHFMPQVAEAVAGYADKVRINPGNYNDRGNSFAALVDKCLREGTAIRIGVNHGSLSEKTVALYGDTPRGMAESALEFLRICRDKGFDRTIISMKSSNTLVMVQAYRMLTAMMESESMRYPLHLGVTEAGNGLEGRIKSAVGIGALLADGLGDTIRVSLTEPPENEIPVAQSLALYFATRERDATSASEFFRMFDPFAYNRRITDKVGRIGNARMPLLYDEFNEDEQRALKEGRIALVSASGCDAAGQWRRALTEMEMKGDRRPVILHKAYNDSDPELFALKAAADFGAMFLDGVADAMWLENAGGIDQEMVNSLSLDILQAARARMSKTEFISCPGCGRTLYALQDTLKLVKSRLSHLKGLKIGVMGCIVNGPGEMADADYGYVGAAPGRISIYRGKERIRHNIPQEDALDTLIEIIKADGRWTEPQ